MIHVLALFLISTLASCASCSSDLKENGKENGKEEKPDTEDDHKAVQYNQIGRASCRERV